MGRGHKHKLWILWRPSVAGEKTDENKEWMNVVIHCQVPVAMGSFEGYFEEDEEGDAGFHILRHRLRTRASRMVNTMQRDSTKGSYRISSSSAFSPHICWKTREICVCSVGESWASEWLGFHVGAQYVWHGLFLAGLKESGWTKEACKDCERVNHELASSM